MKKGRVSGAVNCVAVFGSGKVSEHEPAYQQAVRLGKALAQKHCTVLHGGYRGVMEGVAKGCRLAGWPNTGLTIQGKKKPGVWVDKVMAMPSWQSRLFKLIEKPDAYVFLDGATGTLAEFFVVLEMTNRRLLSKPIVILGKDLRKLLLGLQKCPHFETPSNLYFAGSVPDVLRFLKK